MGDKVLLTVEERTVLGKKVASLRKQGLVPGVVYGQDYTARPVQALSTVVEKVYRQTGKHQPVELTVDGATRLAMIKNADYEPLKHRLRHISFQVVKQNEKVETEVPVRIASEGETAAEKAGLVVLKAVEVVEISALPRHLPSEVVVPSDSLVEPGDHVSVADIAPIEGVEILTDPAIVVATVYEPAALAAKNDALAGELSSEAEVESAHGEAEPAEDQAKPGEAKKE